MRWLFLSIALLVVTAARAPFHGVLSRVARYDTGNPLGFLEAAIAFALRDPQMGKAVRSHLATLV